MGHHFSHRIILLKIFLRNLYGGMRGMKVRVLVESIVVMTFIVDVRLLMVIFKCGQDVVAIQVLSIQLIKHLLLWVILYVVLFGSMRRIAHNIDRQMLNHQHEDMKSLSIMFLSVYLRKEILVQQLQVWIQYIFDLSWQCLIGVLHSSMRLLILHQYLR